MVDLAAHGKDSVVGGVVGLHKVLDHLLIDIGQVLADTLLGLAHEVVTVTGVVHGLEGDFALVLVVVGLLEGHELAFSFDLGGVEGRVGENLTQELNSLFDLSLAGGDGEGGGFTAHIHLEVAAQELELVFELGSLFVLGTS